GSLDDLVAAIEAGEVKGAVVLGAATTRAADELSAFDAATVVSLNTHISPFALRADVVIPVTTHFEHEGSFVNAAGLVRRFDRVVPPVPGVLSGVEAVARLAAILSLNIEVRDHSSARMRAEALTATEGAP